MNYSASDFRSMAREALRGKWKTAILLTIIATLLGAMTSAATLIEFEFESETGFVCFSLDALFYNSGNYGGV